MLLIRLDGGFGESDEDSLLYEFKDSYGYLCYVLQAKRTDRGTSDSRIHDPKF